jgi:hypothetical protein
MMALLVCGALQDAKWAEGLAGYGAVGVCLVALAYWYILKDKRYERRMDDRLKREQEFQEKYAELSEKYRSAMEKFSTTLDVVVDLVKNEKRRG